MTMFRRLAFVVLLSISFAAQSLSGGSPTCHADDIVGSFMGEPIDNMGYALIAMPVAYTPGEAMSITLVNVAALTSVRGVLLYVEDPDALDSESKPIKRGNFLTPFPGGIKATSDSYAGCNFAGQTPVVTHTSSDMKSLPLTMNWQAPAIDTGKLRIRAIALMSFDAYQLLSLDLPVDPVFKNDFE